jgi:putative endonuclease
MQYIVYILYSLSKDKYYIGQTNNLTRRIQEHNSGKTNSTRTGIPWELKYTKEFETRSKAMRFEKKLKGMKSREYL